MLYEYRLETRTRGFVCGPAELSAPFPGTTSIVDGRELHVAETLVPHAWRPFDLWSKVAVRSREGGEILWQRPFADRREALFVYARLLGIDQRPGQLWLPSVYLDGELEFLIATVATFNSTLNDSTHDWANGGTACPAGITQANYLIVAGGGGGGFYGGGGGAGGLLAGVNLVTGGTNYPITVGGAGTASTGSNAAGGSGGNSSFNSNTATGGGGGGTTNANAVSGGSGGGGPEQVAAGQTGAVAGAASGAGIQGSAGGNGAGDNANWGAGGGGGGASAAGAAGTNAGGNNGNGGNGGAGQASAISGASVTYAGGGGGGGFGTGSNGTGGAGGGGNAGSPGSAGTTNRGGGGGGGYTSQNGGAGGTGVVILSFTSVLAFPVHIVNPIAGPTGIIGY